MKCDAWVQTLTYVRPRKRQVTRLVALGTVYGNYVVTRAEAEKNVIHMPRTKAAVSPLIKCGGALVSNLHLEEMPYFGGSSSEIVVEFVCAECGAKFYPALPATVEALNEVLTAWVADYQPKE